MIQIKIQTLSKADLPNFSLMEQPTHHRLNFTHHPSMVHFKERAVFIHVDLLGQEDEAEDLAADCKWPTMQQVRKEFVAV